MQVTDLSPLVGLTKLSEVWISTGEIKKIAKSLQVAIPKYLRSEA